MAQVFKAKSLDQEPAGGEGLRARFDDRLHKLGIDFFAVYCEDIWSDGVLIPQEIDSHLYYPESTYASPNASFYEDTKSLIFEATSLESSALLEDARAHGLVVYRFFSDATKGPASPRPQRFEKLERCVGPLANEFLQREDVKSCAVFMRKEPRCGPNQLRDVLFFNYRQPLEMVIAKWAGIGTGIDKDSDAWKAEVDRYKRAAASLASEMIDRLPGMIDGQSRRSGTAAVQSVRAFAGLVQATERERQARGQADLPRTFDDIAKKLHAELVRDGAGADGSEEPDTSLVVSIYLLKHSASGSSGDTPAAPLSANVERRGEYSLLRVGSSLPAEQRRARNNGARQSGTTSEVDLEWQSPLYGEDSVPSITLTTATLGSPHVLHRVDRSERRTGPGSGKIQAENRYNRVLETSIPLTLEQAGMAVHKCGFPLVSESQLSAQWSECNRTGQGADGICQRLKATSRFLVVQADRPPPPGGSLHRLLRLHPEGLLPSLESSEGNVSTQREAVTASTTLLSLPLGDRWKVLAEKLERRIEFQPAHIFGRLDHDWDEPCSEVCVPLRHAGFSIGCINIESRLINRFRPSYMGMLSSFAMVIEMQLARLVESSIDHLASDAVTKIADQYERSRPNRGSKHGASQAMSKLTAEADHPRADPSPSAPAPFTAEKNTLGINELLLAVCNACRATRCYLVVGGQHRDAEPRFLGVSDPDWWTRTNSWNLPRVNGWSSHLLRENERSRQNPSSGPVTHGLVMWTNDDSAPVARWLFASSGSDGFKLGEDDLKPLFGLNTPNGDRAKKEIMLVACVVGAAKAGTGGAVLWLVYDRPPIARPLSAGTDGNAVPRSEKKESARTIGMRERFLGSVLRTCERLGVVYEVLRSPLVESAEFVQDLKHGDDTFVAISGASSCLQSIHKDLDDVAKPASGGDVHNAVQSAIARNTAARRNLRLKMIEMAVAWHLGVKSESVAQDIGQFEFVYPPLLADEGIQLGTFADVLDAAKKCSKFGENGVEWSLDISLPQPFVQNVQSVVLFDVGKSVAHGRALLLLFVLSQILRNIGKYQSTAGAARARTDATTHKLRVHGGELNDPCPSLALRVSANGGGLQPLWNPADQDYAKRLPFMLGRKEGRGLDMIRRAARAIADSIHPGVSADFVPYDLRNEEFDEGSGRSVAGVVHILRIPIPPAVAAVEVVNSPRKGEIRA